MRPAYYDNTVLSPTHHTEIKTNTHINLTHMKSTLPSSPSPSPSPSPSTISNTSSDSSLSSNDDNDNNPYDQQKQSRKALLENYFRTHRRPAMIFVVTIIIFLNSLTFQIGRRLDYDDNRFEQRQGQYWRNKHSQLTQLTMCNRPVPYYFPVNPAVPLMNQRVFHAPLIAWPTKKKLLMMNGRDTWGNTGNTFNSLLHAFDFARDNDMEVGTTYHSWAMNIFQTIAMGDPNFPSKEYDHAFWHELMEQEYGIKIIKNSTTLKQYDEVHHMNEQDAYYYQTPQDILRAGRYTEWKWSDTMELHKEILRRMFVRHNLGAGYIHNGIRSQNVCELLESVFREDAPTIKYSVIHARYIEGKSDARMKQISKQSKCSANGAIDMSPEYIRSILETVEVDAATGEVRSVGNGNTVKEGNQNMLEYPIILLSDGHEHSRVVEENLLNDPIIGPQLMIFTNKVTFDGADTALALLSNVFIGNPASVTSGFIARSRIALGMKENHLFRRRVKLNFGGSGWVTVCNDECIFKPKVMDALV